jgi:hypothetical protein
VIQQLISPAKALRTLRKTHVLLGELLRGVGQHHAAMLRDGPEGWSVLQIVCHLRDYEIAYRERVELMLAEENPTFTVITNEEWEARGAYASQNLRAVFDDIRARRATFVGRLEGLADEQWLRRGLHPLQGPATVLDVAVNTGLHDVDHLEQIARCLEPLRDEV